MNDAAIPGTSDVRDKEPQSVKQDKKRKATQERKEAKVTDKWFVRIILNHDNEAVRDIPKIKFVGLCLFLRTLVQNNYSLPQAGYDFFITSLPLYHDTTLERTHEVEYYLEGKMQIKSYQTWFGERWSKVTGADFKSITDEVLDDIAKEHRLWTLASAEYLKRIPEDPCFQQNRGEKYLDED